MIRRKLISLPNKSCDFRCGPGALERLNEFAKVVVPTPKRALLMTTETSRPRELACRGLYDAGFSVHEYTPSSAFSRSLTDAQELFFALERGELTADDVLVVLGDVDLCAVGQFCASSWCGGMPALFIPTTFDAMVTTPTSMRPLNLSHSSSMLRLATHPAEVICDIDLLRDGDHTLGLLELLCSALMGSKRAWANFTEIVDKVIELDQQTLVVALGEAQTSRSSVIKASTPSARSGTSFAKTTARALRRCLGEEIPWSLLLAEGIRFEVRLATEAGKFAIDDAFEVDDLVAYMGIDELACALDYETFFAALSEERFKRANRSMFALPQSLGVIRLCMVDDEMLSRHVHAYVKSKSAI